MSQYKVQEKKILIVEDDIPMSDLICYSLKKEGFVVKAAHTGRDGLDLLEKDELPDLIILDINLPDINGLEICQKIISCYNIPVIMLTAKDNIIDKVKGFESGADDYITKPFDIIELIFRIKAVLKRATSVSNMNLINISKTIVLNVDERKVIKNGNAVDMTLKEYELLAFLVKNKGRVLSREQIMNKVWGVDFYGDTRTVDNHVKMLRKKLDDNSGISLIETIYGIGYLFPVNSI